MSVYIWPVSGSKGTFANPDMLEEGYNTEFMPVASSRRTVGGTMKSDFAAIKKRWTLKWSGVAGDPDGATLTGSWTVPGAALEHCYFQPLDYDSSSTFTVRVMETRWYKTAPGRFGVEMVLEEV